MNLDGTFKRLTEKTSLAAILLAGEHILTVAGNETIGDFVMSIPSMPINQLSDTFFPLIIASGLALFKENDAKDKAKESYAKLARAYVKLKRKK